MNIEAMKQALEALEKSAPVNQGVGWVKHHNNAKRALRTAIEQAEKQEPVAFFDPVARRLRQNPLFQIGVSLATWNGEIPLYTAPPAAPVQDIEHCVWARNGNAPCPHTAAQPAQRQWVWLDEDEVEDCAKGCANHAEFYRAIEAKLREKNGGRA
jgi:hypothetical protein